MSLARVEDGAVVATTVTDDCMPVEYVPELANADASGMEDANVSVSPDEPKICHVPAVEYDTLTILLIFELDETVVDLLVTHDCA